jgi:hypothetical protein
MLGSVLTIAFCCWLPLQLAWSNWCETITIDLANDDGVDIRQKMKSLPGLAAPPRLVSKSGSQEWGWTMSITYDTQATQGDLPQIRITDTSKLSGKRLDLTF